MKALREAAPAAVLGETTALRNKAERERDGASEILAEAEGKLEDAELRLDNALAEGEQLRAPFDANVRNRLGERDRRVTRADFLGTG